MSRYLSALEATENYVRSLQVMGVRFLNVSEKTLFALEQPGPVQPAVSVPEIAVAPPVEPPRSVVPPNPAWAEMKTAAETAAIPTELPKTGPATASPAPAAAAGLGREEKAARMAAVRERALACVKCPHLVKSRRTVVFGTGDLHARLMFVGEAPGADEDARGEPFVGAAGQLLTRIIKAMGFTRETVYIANILKCRPDMSGQSSGNRRPTPDEMKTCLPWLLEQIDLVRPAVMVALGATAVEGLLGHTGGITRLRGQFQVFRGIPVMPTFHPSYLLHNQAYTEKRKVWEDMMQVLEKLGWPVTDKQRGFFLKA
jgi:uracil-DNA glycosylase family 4